MLRKISRAIWKNVLTNHITSSYSLKDLFNESETRLMWVVTNNPMKSAQELGQFFIWKGLHALAISKTPRLIPFSSYFCRCCTQFWINKASVCEKCQLWTYSVVSSSVEMDCQYLNGEATKYVFEHWTALLIQIKSIMF